MNISIKLQKIYCIFTETAGLYHKLNVELREELSMPKQTINSALRGLERDGILFLELYRGRNKRAILTEKGWEYCKDTVAHIFEMEEVVFAEFFDSELEAFVTLHKKYNATISKYLEEKIRIKDGQE